MFRRADSGRCMNFPKRAVLTVSDSLSDNSIALGRQFWQNCARLIEVYPNRPPVLSSEAEPALIRSQLQALTTSLASTLCENKHWRGNASVGLGNWTEVPWVAFFDERETTSAQKGVYPVIHISCDSPKGIRLGLGVAATEFKDNPETKAREVSTQFSDRDREELRTAKFSDVVAGDRQRIQLGSGKLARGYARGMVFERFIPVDELKTAPDELTLSLRMLLQCYRSWADKMHGSESRLPSFLDVMRWYHTDKVVFLSPDRQARYVVIGVDATGCEIQRLDADQPVRVTLGDYQKKCQWLQAREGKANRYDLAGTVATHTSYAQGSELAFSADKNAIVFLKDALAAARHFISLLEAISDPRYYKPAILALVIEAIDTAVLLENRISFDWIVPPLLQRMQRLELEGTEEHAAQGFVSLATDLFWMLAYYEPMQGSPTNGLSADTVRQQISHAVIKEPYWRALQDPTQRRLVLNAIARIWPQMSDPPPPPVPLDISSATAKLVSDIEACHFVFQPWQIAAYVTALRTKPFAILAGVSGTGKSKLPVLVASLTGAAQPRRIAVRPDWTDSSEVMGYVDLQNQFRPGVILQEMQAASSSPDQYHVCLVDEMNLARVEHYFAEFLSAVEDRRRANGGGYESSEILTQKLPNDPDGWQLQRIPANLGIVGTVNMDETTHSFSRKVLDRAFTIELSELDLSHLPKDNGAIRVPTQWPVEHWLCAATRIGELDLEDSTIRQIVERAIETLEAVNQCLVYGQLQVGYRTRDEVALFLVNANEVSSSFVTRDGERVDPLDLVLMMKILPRIVGGSNSIGRTLLGLLGFAKDGTLLTHENEAGDIVKAWDSDGRPAAYVGAKFPRTTARVCLMWERLKVEGYTSFWL
ncbi:MAG: MrcB family domain-containing protein [Thermoguttaceae bacterium]